MTDAKDLASMVPGFDFLKGLMKGAGAAVPGMGQWIAPTLDPEEIDKRIGELRTVQFWLEQNARLLATTIQALEVQRMTLSTLQTMNLPLTDLRDALSIKTAAAPPASASPLPAPAPPPPPVPEPAPEARPAAPAAGSVDPMQWWGALTKQFSEIASQALKETGMTTSMPTAAATKPARRPAKAAPAKKAPARKPAAAPRKRSG
jgi:hypothetical protein